MLNYVVFRQEEALSGNNSVSCGENRQTEIGDWIFSLRSRERWRERKEGRKRERKRKRKRKDDAGEDMERANKVW